MNRGCTASGSSNEDLCKSVIGTPTPHLVGVGQGVSGDLASYPQMVEFGLKLPEDRLRYRAGSPVASAAQRPWTGPVPAGRALGLVVALVLFYTCAEFVEGDKIHQLCKHRLPCIHRRSPSAVMQKDGTGKRSLSNR